MTVTVTTLEALQAATTVYAVTVTAGTLTLTDPDGTLVMTLVPCTWGSIGGYPLAGITITASPDVAFTATID